jgi:bifunctional non-homologous end joining protein LigD
VSDPFDRLSDEERKVLKKRAFPTWMDPMLATLTDKRFSDPDWIYEPKLDGVRLVVYRKGSKVRLMSRNKKERSAAYPEIAEAIEVIDPEADDFVLDGEVVAFDDGVTSFSKLQDRMGLQDPDKARATGIDVYYYAFDLLYLDGRDTTKLPLRRRKALLKRALDFHDPIRFMTHRNEEGEKYFKEACAGGLEGLIAKRASSEYVHARSSDWLKFKCAHGQEFVIGGFTDPQRARKGFGALLVGYYDGDELRYAGKVGTGYTDEMLEELRSKLERSERKTPPFAEDELPSKGVHWVSPRLVAEVGFTEWTGDGRLRHPRFLGLRDDKAPRRVVRERSG